jgi:hypothetical protein
MLYWKEISKILKFKNYFEIDFKKEFYDKNINMIKYSIFGF